MSASFAASLRARAEEIHLGEPGAGTVRVRVEVPEVWDMVRVVAAPTECVHTVKQQALAALFPNGGPVGDFIVKFRGWEILDEQTTLADAGVGDGATLLVTNRRRRAVR